MRITSPICAQLVIKIFLGVVAVLEEKGSKSKKKSEIARYADVTLFISAPCDDDERKKCFSVDRIFRRCDERISASSSELCKDPCQGLWDRFANIFKK